MNHLPDNFIVCLDLFLDWETYEQGRRWIRGLSNFSKQDATYSLFSSVIDLLEGNLQEALRSFSELLEHRTLDLAALTGQVCVYEKQEIRDPRSADKLQSLRSQSKSHQEPDGLYLSSWILFRLGKYVEAAESLQDILRNQVDHGLALALLAQVELRSGGSPSKAKSHLDTALKVSGTHTCQARITLVHWLIEQNELDQAQTELRDLSGMWDKLAPVRAAAITLQMSLRNWDGVADATDRLLALDPQLLIGHIFMVLSLIYTSSSAKRRDLDRMMQTLLEKIQKAEPKNPALWAKYARICSKTTAGDEKVVERTLAMTQQMTITCPNHGHCFLEAGDELLQLAKAEEARGYFQRAMKFPAFIRPAMIGEAKALLKLGLLDEASQQCDRISDLLKLGNSDAYWWLSYSDEVALLKILIQSRFDSREAESGKVRGKNSSRDSVGVSKRLSDLLVGHLHHLKVHKFNLDFVLRIDPGYVQSLVSEALQRCPVQPLKVVLEDSLFRHCENLLTFLNSSAPGLTDLTVLLARVNSLKNDLSAASRLLEMLIESERFGLNSAVFVEATEVYLTQGNLVKGKTALDRAVANSFAVKNSLRFLCLQARFFRLSGKRDDCLKLLVTTLERPGVRRMDVTAHLTETVQDRCSVFLDLADCYFAGKDSSAAFALLAEADTVFRGTSQAPRVILARAEYLAAINLKSKQVVDLLQSVDPDARDFYYLAQEKLATYYLKNGMRNEYVLLCERLFVQMGETPAASIMLGNAYLKIPMAKQAVEAIQSALKRQPGNVKLESAMGLVLTKCHLFANALNYYEAAVKKGNRAVRPDYISLLVKLKRYERVEELLTGFTSEENSDLDDQLRTAHFFKSLADVQQTLCKSEERLDTLKRGQLYLEKLNVRLHRENRDTSVAVRRLMAEILTYISEVSLASGDHTTALQLTRQCQTLLQGDDSIPALLQQAHIHLQQSNTSEAFRLIKDVQKLQPDNRAALKLIGDVAYRRKDFEMAANTYREFLRVFPDDLIIISQIIPILGRMGQMQYIKAFLSDQSSRSNSDNKNWFQYCTGVFCRYTGDAEAAVAIFMKLRKDAGCGLLANGALVELLCNWDLELAGSQNLPGTLRTTNVKTICQRILKDLPANSARDSSLFALHHLPILSGGSTADLTALVADLELTEQIPEEKSVQKSFVLASVLLLLGQKERAVPILRRFEKTTWNIQDADYLERMWLLLADQLDITNRGDEVSHLVFRSMEYNKGLYMTNMFEGLHCSVQNFPKAAECFRRAFEASGNRDFVSGERYVWAQLNANRPMDAVEGLDLLERAVDAVDRKEEADGLRTSIRSMRNQALLQLALRVDERSGRADAAGRRQSIIRP